MVLAASCEFDKRLNSEIVERPSDNEEIPEVFNAADLVIWWIGNYLLLVIPLSGLTMREQCCNHHA